DTMELCQQLEFAVRAGGVSEATLDHLAVADRAAAATLRAVFDEIWDHLGQTTGAWQVALRIAKHLPGSPPSMHTQVYSRAAKALLDKGVIRRAPGRGQFTFAEPLFERYVAGA
ncbi:MAG TPA: hypothetical protein VKU60_11025, partial [Chloroflexota bacterium]|nr:hypothetical protein [Chloroflexota bacterium]